MENTKTHFCVVNIVNCAERDTKISWCIIESSDLNRKEYARAKMSAKANSPPACRASRGTIVLFTCYFGSKMPKLKIGQMVKCVDEKELLFRLIRKCNDQCWRKYNCFFHSLHFGHMWKIWLALPCCYSRSVNGERGRKWGRNICQSKLIRLCKYWCVTHIFVFCFNVISRIEHIEYLHNLWCCNSCYS